VLEDAPNSVLVSTSAANTPALTLYRSLGFRETKTFVSHEGFALCSLEWLRRERPEIAP
jgi:ribosomal protein S18 acetylase RimI-like enzyme